MSCRSRLAILNEKLTTLERRIEYLEARVRIFNICIIHTLIIPMTVVCLRHYGLTKNIHGSLSFISVHVIKMG